MPRRRWNTTAEQWNECFRKVRARAKDAADHPDLNAALVRFIVQQLRRSTRPEDRKRLRVIERMFILEETLGADHIVAGLAGLQSLDFSRKAAEHDHLVIKVQYDLLKGSLDQCPFPRDPKPDTIAQWLQRFQEHLQFLRLIPCCAYKATNIVIDVPQYENPTGEFLRIAVLADLHLSTPSSIKNFLKPSHA